MAAPPLNIIITFIYWGCLFEATLAARDTIKMSEPKGGLGKWGALIRTHIWHEQGNTAERRKLWYDR